MNSKIRIKNFGPIKEGFCESEDGFFEINKLTVFVGEQGAGKSSIAKLVSSFEWTEKAVLRQDSSLRKYSLDDVNTSAFFNELFSYHNIIEYFTDKTYIEYISQYFIFVIKSNKMTVNKKNTESNFIYEMPKIMYIPAERVFLSAVSNPNKIKGLPRNLYTVLEEFYHAGEALKGKQFKLPIKNYFVEYNSFTQKFFITDKNNSNKIEINLAASGLQSSTPLLLISDWLCKNINAPEFGNKSPISLEEKEKIIKKYQNLLSVLGVSITTLGILISSLALLPAGLIVMLTAAGIGIPKEKKEPPKDEEDILFKIKKEFQGFYSSWFLNIVEEPEQNLFPEAQKDVTLELLKYCNKTKENKLILTTHSPYVLGTLNNSIYAGNIAKKNKAVNDIIEKKYQMSSNNVVAYKVENGEIINIMDRELKQINNDEIDGCSEIINSDYHKIENIEFNYGI